MGTIARGTKAGGGTNFNSGQTIDPAENNTDHNTMYTEFNGNIENVNVKAAAAIASSKIAFDGVRVTNSGVISLLTGVTTLMTFDTETDIGTYDTGTYHSTSSNTGRLIAPSFLRQKRRLLTVLVPSLFVSMLRGRGQEEH